MITAKEARAISKQKNGQADEKIMCEIERKIKVACEEGKTQIRCDGTISYRLMKELNRLGYYVELSTSYEEEEYYFTVDW